jgi:hypothetical protein
MERGDPTSLGKSANTIGGFDPILVLKFAERWWKVQIDIVFGEQSLVE